MSDETSTIQLIKTSSDNALPSQVTFPSTIPPMSYIYGSNKDSSDILEYKKYKQESSNTQKTALYAENSKFEYLGKHNPFTSDKKYILGFLDESKKKQKVIGIQDYFSINQHIKNQIVSTSFGINTDVDNYEQKKILVEELGTNKSKTILRKLQGKVIKEEAINSLGELKQMIKSKGDEIREEINEEKTQKFQQQLVKLRQVLPDFNFSAKIPEKIYNFRSIISDADFEHLDLKALSNRKALHQYVNDILYKNNDKLQGPESVPRKRQILYQSYMLSIFRHREISVNLNELSEQQSIPFPLVASIVKRFFEVGESKTDSKRYIRSKSLDLKFSCYVLVLALIVQDFKIPIKPQMKWLKRDESKMMNLAREVGCKVSKTNDGYIAKLTKIVLEDTARKMKKMKK